MVFAAAVMASARSRVADGGIVVTSSLPSGPAAPRVRGWAGGAPAGDAAVGPVMLWGFGVDRSLFARAFRDFGAVVPVNGR